MKFCFYFVNSISLVFLISAVSACKSTLPKDEAAVKFIKDEKCDVSLPKGTVVATGKIQDIKGEHLKESFFIGACFDQDCDFSSTKTSSDGEYSLGIKQRRNISEKNAAFRFYRVLPEGKDNYGDQLGNIIFSSGRRHYRRLDMSYCEQRGLYRDFVSKPQTQTYINKEYPLNILFPNNPKLRDDMKYLLSTPEMSTTRDKYIVFSGDTTTVQKDSIDENIQEQIGQIIYSDMTLAGGHSYVNNSKSRVYFGGTRVGVSEFVKDKPNYHLHQVVNGLEANSKINTLAYSYNSGNQGYNFEIFALFSDVLNDDFNVDYEASDWVEKVAWPQAGESFGACKKSELIPYYELKTDFVYALIKGCPKE